MLVAVLLPAGGAREGRSRSLMFKVGVEKPRGFRQSSPQREGARGRRSRSLMFKVGVEKPRGFRQASPQRGELERGEAVA
jgi:hypothetical protein